jgi:regulator of protease activity HflC (stomatin/prohibitin superfamily)
MNTAANEWGIKILRYEIKDIHPPSNVVESMHRQVSAERKKRAEILESEGSRQSAINIAEGSKQSQILESEAIKQRQINIAKGEAEAILARAAGTAEALKTVSSVLKESGASGDSAVNLALAEKYIEAFSNLAKESNTVIVPSNVADASGMLTQMMSVIKGIQKPQ